MMDRRNFLRTASSFTLLTVGAKTDASRTTGESIGKYLNLDKLPGMCAKEPMTADGIIRLSKLLSLLAGLSGVWSDNINDLTMCSVSSLYL